ncbi:MAG TPA: SMR family transporter [Bauldia sp.]|nr:SMR family transporter [Bauldia sp.]
MSLLVFSALLAAALLHAGWNALVRGDRDRNAATVAIAAGGVVVGLAMAPFLPPMDVAAIPFVLGSSCFHIVYYALIARAYRHADLSVAYPIMRGLAPVIVTVIGAVFLRETVGALQFAGITIVAAGIVSLGLEGRGNSRSGIAAALLNAGVIAGYTLVDGLGARASGAPATYTAWILVGGGILTLIWNIARLGTPVLRATATRAGMGLAGGIMGFGAYAIALWAMTVAPIGAVAAVRESSVLFAAALGAIFLGERFGPGRWLAAALVALGLAMVRFAGA